MIRVSGISGFVRLLGLAAMSTVVLAVVSSCSESTAPEMTLQPSSDGVAVIEFSYPDSVKNSLFAGAASRLAGNGISANVLAPSDGSFAATPGAPMYTVAAVPFAPEAAPSVRVPKICDDCVITGVPLGFTFAFYGQSYDKLTIGTNGIVGFGALDAQGNPTNMTDGCCWSRFIHLKDVNNNIIALGWADWVPVTTTQIKYETRGSAPNRRFILQLTNIGENAGNGHITAQLVLYESSNEITLYTTELSTTLAKRAFTQGIENLAATEAEYIAGRDSAKFALSNDGVKFTPVSPNKPPVITAPSNISLNTASSACVVSSVVSAPAFTDDAPGATINGVRSDALDLSAAYPKGTTTITWTATDVEGLKTSATQTVTVADKEKPALTAPANIAVRVNVTVSFASVNVGTATVTSDNCKDAVVSGSRSDNAPLNAGYPLGVTTITWTALDASGNSSTATQTVTVTPNVAPKLIVPANIVKNTDARACVATIASLGTPVFTDDLDGVKLVGERSDRLDLGAAYPKGMTTVHWTATDADGATVSADQLVTVNDLEAPSLEAVSNISVRQERGVPRAAVPLSQPGASDNCANVEVSVARSDNQPLNAVFQVGTTTVTWTARDASQNITKVSQTVTVVGNVPPVVTTANIVANTDRGVCGAALNIGTPSVKDDIDGWSLAGERSDGQPLNAAYPRGVTTVKWTATDYDYATSSTNQTVSVNDNEKPRIVAPQSLSVPNDRGKASAVVATGTPSVEENCPLVKVDGARSDGAALAAAYPVGVTTITWTATDASGNSASAQQSITVRDVEAPSLILPGDFTVNATSPSGAVVRYNVNASDNVGVVSLVCEPRSGSVVAIGYKEIDCAASDAAGNIARAEFGVRVLGASEQIANLIGYIQSLHLSNGVENPLVNQLRNADKNPNACQKMDDFIHMASVKDGSLTSAQSSQMLTDAARIQSVLGCAGVPGAATARSVVLRINGR
ncbi:MAG TPA: HYR domain-containing protein [Gemmatimonadaceae bacterium]